MYLTILALIILVNFRVFIVSGHYTQALDLCLALLYLSPDREKKSELIGKVMADYSLVKHSLEITKWTFKDFYPDLAAAQKEYKKSK